MPIRWTLGALLVLLAGCKKHEVPPDVVGSYTRSGVDTQVRAELSIARGGMALTVVKLSVSADAGAFASLFTRDRGAVARGGGAMRAGADVNRTVTVARTFKSVACDASVCTFELAPDGDEEACSGSFERVGSTVVVIASGTCKPLSGRWSLLEALPGAPAVGAPTPGAPAPVAPPSAAAPVDAGAPRFEVPADVPPPHDAMSCLQTCSLLTTRCQRAKPSPDRDSFLACVEQHQLCNVHCEHTFPFFGSP